MLVCVFPNYLLISQSTKFYAFVAIGVAYECYWTLTLGVILQIILSSFHWAASFELTRIKMSGQWQNSIFGCFGDCTTCKMLQNPLLWFIFFCTGLLSFICPCIQFGRNAEAVGENCLMYALSQFVPILDLYCRTVVRGKIRQQKAIDGSCLNDLICHFFCEACALAQEAQVYRLNKYFYNMLT